MVFILFLVVLATTVVFSSIAQYLDDFSITPLGAVGCLAAALLIFYGVYKVLAKQGESFLPEGEE